jgi:hypothetical protein
MSLIILILKYVFSKIQYNLLFYFVLFYKQLFCTLNYIFIPDSYLNQLLYFILILSILLQVNLNKSITI